MPKLKQHPNVLAEALRLRKRGFAVVPCRGKRAIVSGWAEKRLSSDELRDMLSDPDLNIAIALNQSDLIDVECDTTEAETTLQELFGGEMPPTPTWKSKRGKHRLFKRPSGIPKKAKIEIDGIEFRLGNEKGALSVVPPSVHPDGPRYEWEAGLSIHEIEPAELPPEIVERLCNATPQPTTAPIKTSKGAIPEGKRNDELFKLACKLRDTGIAEKSIVDVLLTENRTHCTPPLAEGEVRDIVCSTMKRETKGAQTNAATLLDIATYDCELWHTAEGDAYATIHRNGHREHWPIRSRAYRQWLSKEFYDQRQNAVGTQTLQDTINTLEGKAQFDGPTYPTSTRIAGLDGKIYVDLGDDKWRAIEIDSSGWRVVNSPPVRFRRAKAMEALPEPMRGGSVTELRKFVNVVSHCWALLLAWIVAAFRPTGPYPLLKLLGEQGSAKTTSARMVRSLVDPNTASVRSAPRSERDLMIAANNGWVVNLDNMSHVTSELSDSLCRLATGGGFATRTLYENDEETIFNAQRPVILNGIEDIGTRSDLLDRSVTVELPRIEPENRRAERDLWRDFEKARPLILGALFDAVSAALRNLPAVEQSDSEWPRMADFAQWAVAAEAALGLEPGEFLNAYSENCESANQTALDSSPVVTRLRAMLKRKTEFVGTATELLSSISVAQDTRVRGWPKAPKVLSGMLKRLAPNLRAVGINVEQITIGSGNAKRQGWKIWDSSPSGTKSKPRRKPSKTSDPCDRKSVSKRLVMRAGLKGRTGRKSSN